MCDFYLYIVLLSDYYDISNSSFYFFYGTLKPFFLVLQEGTKMKLRITSLYIAK
jgi:hypothetical protein